MTKITAQNLKIGDKIMPPAREVSLWMRRDCKARELPESALHLTITDIQEAAADKGGRWLSITADHAPEWNANGWPFKFKARPQTPWVVIT